MRRTENTGVSRTHGLRAGGDEEALSQGGVGMERRDKI